MTHQTLRRMRSGVIMAWVLPLETAFMALVESPQDLTHRLAQYYSTLDVF